MKIWTKALAVALLAGAATNAPAATNISLDGLGGAEYDTAGVYIYGDLSFTGVTDDGGGLDLVLFEIFDDGALKFSQIYSLLVGTSGTFHFDTSWPGLIGTGAPGLGLVVEDAGQNALVIDPFYLAHYADPTQCERDCGPQGAVPEPSSWALMLLGFAGVGAAIRRRRKAVPALKYA